MSSLVYLLLLIVSCLILAKATSLVVKSIDRLADLSHIPRLGLASFLLAFATSLPELSVAITAALANDQALVLGNILGSNIANLTIVIGSAAIIGHSLRLTGSFLQRDIFYAFIAGALPLLLLLDGQLNRIDGLLLLLTYGFYNWEVLTQRRRLLSKKRADFHPQPIKTKKMFPLITHFTFAAALLIGAAKLLVYSAEHLSSALNLPIFIVGLILVALGTSLPELAFEIRAIKARQIHMAFGDLLGSIVANSTLIIGIATLIKPISLDGTTNNYLSGTLTYLAVFTLFAIFTNTKKRLDRWEGVVLIIFYFAFLIFELLK